MFLGKYCQGVVDKYNHFCLSASGPEMFYVDFYNGVVQLSTISIYALRFLSFVAVSAFACDDILNEIHLKCNIYSYSTCLHSNFVHNTK